MYATPAMMLAPNMAGNLNIFIARFGSILTKEIDRIAGTLWMELAPEGHGRLVGPLYLISPPDFVTALL